MPRKDSPIRSGVPVQTLSTLENVHRWLKLVGEMVTAVVIIATFSSVIIGTLVIRIYLSNFSLSLSPLDTLSAVSLQVFMVFFITLLGSIVALFLAPLTATYFVGPETRASLPNLFGRRYVRPETQRAKTAAGIRQRPPILLTRGTFSDFLIEYVMFYFPILVILCTIPIEAILGISDQAQSTTVPYIVLSSFVVSAFLLYAFRLKGRPAKLGTYYSLLYLNLITILWVLLLEIGMSRAWERGVASSTTSATQTIAEGIVLSSLGLVCHASMAWPRFSVRVLVVLSGLIVYFLHVYPGYAAIGAEALREAQLGGGARISYTLTGPQTTPLQPTSGCLVLATSSYVLISELDDNRCAPLTRFVFTASEAKPRPVRVFSRNEVKLGEASN